MIGKLTGRLDYRSLDHIVLDVGGVGYVIHCSERVLATLPGPGAPVSLYTDLLVREDLLQLFGFTTLLEKEWHRLLMGVQGVGAKASLAILGALGADGVARAITLGDINAIKAAKGIGPKTAQRIVIELKDKAPGVMALGGTLPAAQGETAAAVIEPGGQTPASPMGAPMAQADALSALVNLGYSHGDAASAIAQGGGEDTATVIRDALKLLAPKD